VVLTRIHISGHDEDVCVCDFHAVQIATGPPDCKLGTLYIIIERPVCLFAHCVEQ
jgi:hypothetical protein